MPIEWEKLSPLKRILFFDVIVLIIALFIAAVLYSVENGAPYLKDTVLVILTAFFGGMLYDLFKKVNTINKDDCVESPSAKHITSVEHNSDEPPINDDQLGVLKDIRHHLKNSNFENRDLKYSTVLLSCVALIFSMAALTKDKLPFPYLGLVTLVSIFSIMAYIYLEFRRIHINPFFVIIPIFIVVTLVILINPSILTLNPSTVVGNVTNICDNCTYPVTNVVNNYNVTIVGNCADYQKQFVSVEGMKNLMNKM